MKTGRVIWESKDVSGPPAWSEQLRTLRKHLAMVKDC